MNTEFVRGIFVREEKNRFICTVNVNGFEEECYIPSSCKLGNFIELAGKEVVLRENNNKSARTRYAVYAIQYMQNYIILRTAEANDIIRNALKTRCFSYLGKRSVVEKECKIGDYKSDLYLPESKTVIEIKSVISTSKEAVFPTVYSERAIEQFRKIKHLLCNGYTVVYIYVSLNPYVKKVSISAEESLLEYSRLFNECIQMGMQARAYSAEIKNNIPVIKKEIVLVT